MRHECKRGGTAVILIEKRHPELRPHHLNECTLKSPSSRRRPPPARPSASRSPARAAVIGDLLEERRLESTPPVAEAPPHQQTPNYLTGHGSGTAGRRVFLSLGQGY